MTAWSRSPMARSGSGISAILASTALSPSALSARGPRRAAAFSSWARSFIAPRSSSVNPSNFLSIAVVLLADFCVSFIAGFLPCESSGGRQSWVLKQPEDVAIGVGDGGHQAAATYVAHGLLHGGTGSGHLGQLRLDVQHVPKGHRRGHALRST